MRACPDCGRQLVDVTSMGPQTATIAEYACGCPGRVWQLARRTGAIRGVDEPPAAALDDRD